jgi:putative transposase
LVDKNLKSYFALLKKYKKDKKSLNGCPRFPKYKHKTEGRNVMIFSGSNQIRFRNNFIIFPTKLNIKPLFTKIPEESKINEVRIIPKNNHYTIEIVYEKQQKEIIINNNKTAIDLGVNNLMTLTTNLLLKPLIINGRKLKSINQYYNKKKGKLQSELKTRHNKYNSKRINRLTLKRDNKIKDYLHKSSKYVVDYLKKNNITSLVVGYNKEWKQDVNLGKKNNQNFVNIPYRKQLDMLKYKCELEGIVYTEREENYTSKCSSLEKESIGFHEKYLGDRIKRGLFKTSTGLLINSDVNGSLNIGRKEFGDDYLMEVLDSSTNRGLVLNPVKVTLS